MRLLHTALLALALLLAGCGERVQQNQNDGLRVISLAPNVTEILYALGLSNEVVGVSRYSKYPPEAAEKPFVGGTYDPNWEMIIALQPDLVIGLDSQEEIAVQLKQLNIDFLGVPHERVDEVMQSILIIGEACGAEAEAQQLFQCLEATALRHRDLSEHRKPKVLVCIGHDEQLTRMYVAARNTFYDDLINLAGGINACEQAAIKYPEISPEGLRAIDPDLVIDISPNLGKSSFKLWQPYRAVSMTNSYAFIPGPRFGLLLQDFLEAIRQNDLEAE
ncbi:MAG: ABC transporter substrate-binding protein [Kiritimatiellales bacterium]|nr:ABC transporter substrate-binding protein [Kiritimatiellota bacterium]MBL7015938.1 ABC transporter substrate-binding protein [Kiritimatiellales bacterium]